MLKIYVDLMSQPARALYMFVKHTKIPHTVVPVAVRKGENLSDEYIKINPFKQVPAIDDTGFKLNESIAIFRYLCAKYDVPDSIYPKDIESRAKVDAFLSWQHLNVRSGAFGIFRNGILQRLMGNEPNPEMFDQSVKIFKASLNKIENIFLKDTPFIYSQNMTVADLIGVCEVMQPYLGANVDVVSGNPNIASWIDGVKQTVGSQLFDETHQFVQRIGEHVKASGIPMPKL